MKLSEFDYTLPEELIAKSPAEPRDSSRLLILSKSNGKISHHTFYEVTEFLNKGDLLVINNSKVFPARLFGEKKTTGGKVEMLLTKNLRGSEWEVIGKNLKEGTEILFRDSELTATVLRKEEKTAVVKFNLGGEKFFEIIERIGHTPLPPYIKKEDSDQDKADYQTVYAKHRGSAAAPTAGLHFTQALLEKVLDKGVDIAEVTLHVGLGTFAPVEEKNIEDHLIHSEYYVVTPQELEKIVKAKKEGRRVIAVGTTSARVLETIFAVSENYEPKTINSIAGETNIFIYPGYKFKCIDGLITNFHLPKSTLLMLVSAFAGKENIDRAYKEAIRYKYRFYSYGDAMLII